MHNEYYGIASTPTSDYLAHYGIKGMKWGVRKAIESNNSKALTKQYKKAYKKLQRLNSKTDIAKQKKLADRYAKIAGAGLMTSLAGAGIGTSAIQGLRISRNKYNAALNNRKNIRKQFSRNIDEIVAGASQSEALRNNSNQAYRKALESLDNNGRAIRQAEKNINNSRTLAKVGIAADYAGLLAAGLAGTESLVSRYRTTPKGHAKAIAKRDAWQKEMRKVFKGTEYQNIPKYTKSKKRRR